MKTLAPVVLALVMVVFAISTASATDVLGEKHWNIYGKTGWFSWSETDHGSSFIREYGPFYAVGAERASQLFDSPLSISGLIEGWGGVIYHDGHTIDNSKAVKTATMYLGTREEVMLDAKLPVPFIQNVYLDPFIGVGHKFWFRLASAELWNMLYSRIGMKASYTTSGITAYIGGGKTIPIDTWNYVCASMLGDYTNATLKPRARQGLFLEAGAKFSSWDMSLSYEETSFERSESVDAGKGNVSGSGSGGATLNSGLYQPESKTSTIWLKLSYSF